MKTRELKDGLTYYIPKYQKEIDNYYIDIDHNQVFITQEFKWWTDHIGVDRTYIFKCNIYYNKKLSTLRESKNYIIFTPIPNGIERIKADSNIIVAGDRVNFQWREEVEEGVKSIEDVKKIWNYMSKSATKYGIENHHKFGSKMFIGTSGKLGKIKGVKKMFENGR